LDINLLCIGDVVGRPGRMVVAQTLPKLVREHSLDCVIANVENAAAGSGLTEGLHAKFLRFGVNLLTMGDHIYRRGDLIPVLERSASIVRPANFPPESAGRESAVYQTPRGPQVAVVSLLGRLFMKPIGDCPFHAIDRVLGQMPPEVKIVAVDVHAEATSEKIAMGWYLNGRVSVVFGTHTHVATADERILDQGTAYITDLGMTGPFDVASGDIKLSGILVKVDSETGRALHIERISVPCPAGAFNEPED
jgi:metallophosphoesterase (TIGR00282 family)